MQTRESARVRDRALSESDHQGSGITASLTDAADYVVDLHRRRAAAERLCILPSGRADPWHYPPLEPSERNRQAARDTWHHLAELGYASRCPVWQARMAELLGVAN